MAARAPRSSSAAVFSAIAATGAGWIHAAAAS
jgi:hypothetical protein